MDSSWKPRKELVEIERFRRLNRVQGAHVMLDIPKTENFVDPFSQEFHAAKYRLYSSLLNVGRFGNV